MNRKTNKNDGTNRTHHTGNSTSKRGRPKRALNGDFDETDNTSHLANPPDEVNLREVQLPKAVPNVKQHDLAPVRGGTMLDLDTEQITIYIDDGQDEQNGRSEDQDHKTNYIIIPGHASWFDNRSVHIIEKRSLSGLFNNLAQLSTDAYMNLRNLIIDTYRLNPTEYLSVTTCSRKANADICAIVKLHAFLEHWGLINYHVEPELRPAPLGPPPNNHFHLIAETSSSLRPLGPDGKIIKKKSNYINSLQVYNPRNREDNQPIVDRELTEEERKSRTNFGLRLDDYFIHNINFSNRGAAKVYKEWDEKETLALLEAIELYKDDWHKVSEHVGCRTQDECILHFLRLPIEDPFLTEDEFEEIVSRIDQHQPIPFSKSGNPIMSTIAFLASVIDPGVAAAAAKAALKEFSKIAEAHETDKEPIDDHSLTRAASCALTAASEKAKHLARVEERKIKSLVSVLVDTQLKKLGIKIKHYEELDTVVNKEKETTENQRKQLVREQNEFQEEQVRAEKFRAGQIKVENMINPEPPPT